MTNVVDDLVHGSHEAATAELRHMLQRIEFSDMTPGETVAFVTLLRPVFDRVQAEIEAEKAPAEQDLAPIIRLVSAGTD